MKKGAILFVDDRQRSLPSREEQGLYLSKYGLDSLLCDPNNPIQSGFNLLQSRSDVLGVLSDRCKQPKFEHFRKFHEIVPHLLIAAFCGVLTEQDRNTAFQAGAEYCFLKTDSFESFLANSIDSMEIAKRRFAAEFPRLLNDDAFRGKWVAYTNEGLYAHDDNDIALIRICEKKLRKGEYLIDRILPDFGIVDLRDAYLVQVSP